MATIFSMCVGAESRFDAIVGRSALNECLSSFIPAEEQHRFEVASTKSPASARKVRVLTTTILNDITGVRADLDFFMVSSTDESWEADTLLRVAPLAECPVAQQRRPLAVPLGAKPMVGR